MNLFTDFEARIKNALEQIDIVKEKRSELDFGRVAVEPPRDASHGDVATNAAMVLAKSLGTNPRALAEIIIAKLKEDADVADVSVAGPGFINIRLSIGYWQRLLASIIAAGTDYGRSKLVPARRSMSNMSRQTRPARCMSAIAAAPSSETRWRICSPSPAMPSRRNTTSTMQARRSTCWRAPSSCATAKRLAKASAISRPAFIRAII